MGTWLDILFRVKAHLSDGITGIHASEVEY
jgi:hypothetical protein